MTELYDRTQESALVVFSGETDIAWLRLLRPGFRHCFVILKTPDRWIAVDPLAHMTRIGLPEVAAGFDMAGYLRGEGMRVIETNLREAPPVPAPPMLCTCVEIVKRIIGIQKWSVMTPWQLYRFLQK
jgi:hypothetical protein